MFRISIIIYMLFILLGTGCIEAKSDRHDVTLDNKNISIALPGNYYDTDAPICTLYLLNGDTHFDHVSATAAEMARTDLIPPIIVVGISTSGADLANPFDQENTGLRIFLKEKCVPHIDAQFRTAPYRIIAGGGLAGLYCSYIMFEEPDLFDAHFWIAPELHRVSDFESVLRIFLTDHFQWNHFIYFSMGFGDQSQMRETLEIARLLNAHDIEREIEYHFDLIRDEFNGTVVHQSFYNGLKALFADTRYETMMPFNGINHYYEKQEKLLDKYGYNITGVSLPKISIARPVLAALQTNKKTAPLINELVVLSDPGRYDTTFAELDNLARFLDAENRKSDAALVRDMNSKRFPDHRDRVKKGENSYGESVDIKSGLVAHYKLDGHGEDSSPNKQHSTTETITGGSNRFGQADGAVEFNGQSKPLVIEFDSSFSKIRSLSVSCWICNTSRGRFNAVLQRNWLNKNTTQWRLGFGPVPDQQWGMTVWHYGWKDYLINDEVPLNQWVHLVMVVDHSLGRVTYYRDGKKIGFVEQVFPFPYSGGSFYVGGESASLTSYSGLIDEIRIYNRALNEAEVFALHKTD